MQKIGGGKVRMKPKWWFSTITAGRRGVWWGMVLMAAGGIAAIAYFGQIYDVNEVREYGELGWRIWASEFPYGWFLAATTGIGGGIILLSKIGDNYRRAVLWMWIITIVGVGILAVVLMWWQGLL